MSRLSEKEIDVIRQARAASQRDASRPTDSGAAARGNRGNGLAERLAVFRDFVRPFLDAAANRRVMSHLRQMDDRMLRDIGIERGALYGLSSDLPRAAPAETVEKTGVFARIVAFFRRRDTLQQLRSLDDRILEDIGLNRATLADAIDAPRSAKTVATHAPIPTQDSGSRVPVDALRGLNMNRRLMTEIANLGPIMILSDGHMKPAKKTA